MALRAKILRNHAPLGRYLYNRPYKILLVQVGTLSFSHPSFGVPVLFFYYLLSIWQIIGISSPSLKMCVSRALRGGSGKEEPKIFSDPAFVCRKDPISAHGRYVPPRLCSLAFVPRLCRVPCNRVHFDRARYKGVLRALLARRPRRRRGTIDKSAIYPHTSK